MGNLKLTGVSSTKPPIGELPERALTGAVRVLEDGAAVYAAGNYLEQSVTDAVRAYDNALGRHRRECKPLSGYATPESYATRDEDSGLPHIDHMIAGLLILRTLMIRDGALPEDPGMGKRKRAAFDQKPLGEPGGWYTCKEHGSDKCLHAPEKLKLDTSDPHTAAVFETCKQAAAEVASWPAWKRGEDPNADLRALAERIATRELPARDASPANTPALPARDPDAERRAAGDAHVEQLKREQADLAEQKRKWEQRCLLCNGNGEIPYSVDADKAGAEKCYKCNGTGEKTGAEGVRW